MMTDEARRLIAENRRLQHLVAEMEALKAVPLEGLGLADLLAHRERLDELRRYIMHGDIDMPTMTLN